MKLYNTLTRSKDELNNKDNTVRMYACGPTVYNYFHIGNARCFVVFDMLRRYLEYRGNKVIFVQNFTDVEDKLIRKAEEEGVSVKQVADKYIDEYFTDAKGLGIRKASYHPRATENIDGIISIVSKLIENNHAYVLDGDVYFDTKSFNGYGKLSHMPIDDLEHGARIDVNDKKRSPMDFALWKAQKDGEEGWESPWGIGRPGWHIECSAMVNKYLGEEIDIHCGGQDLIFPHHENEIAQSECATGKALARFWVHNGYINVDNKKMSKSLNNFFLVRDVAKVYGYQTIRYFLLSAHYRSPINYTSDILEQSQAALTRLHNCQDNIAFRLDKAPDAKMIGEEQASMVRIGELKEKFIASMDDDFN
ncbi:MAG TPA: cysteine--tRNA ligase, partial [Bacillota bacterium]|nr:cysteine--tRNA ligase [Bacillota bacterium]